MGCPLLFYIKIVAHYVNIYQVITICSEQFNIIFSMEYRYLIVFFAQNAQNG